jgi:non-homologous end joining protein Ku
LDEPAPKSQPADLTEILRASVAAVKSGRDKDTQTEEPKPAKSRTRRKASA